ncbi:hypothetical protein [Telmatospirillum siberiense]|uniref:DUF3035 domain-containing protein n=1 Tax=Telmatospirillum siberiense TaxID=382514 RepID=A0A2N3PNN7_9PROT|nr:hypothetical protein [Telmatospirillum siberiense]PKU22019.1 hypothetical protein CWS72_23720 [Telmatospirillum siberiense]
MHRPLAVALAAIVLLSLSGCGKAGRPQQPPGSEYPRTYPDPSTSPTSLQRKDGRTQPSDGSQQDQSARFTSGGSYIDPSAQVPSTPQILLNSNLPNTTSRTTSTDPFSQGINNSGQSALQPQQTTPSSDEQEETAPAPASDMEEGTAQ